MEVTVCVATFGSTAWYELGQERAVPSAKRFGVPVVSTHTTTLERARNDALRKVGTEFVCFLDADDELEPGFFDAIQAAGDADIRAPSVRYIQSRGHRSVFGEGPGQAVMPRVWGHTHQCEGGCLAFGNWIVIGAVARTEALRSIGGFRDWPCIEDWDLWARAWQSGATFLPAPEAVYRAYADPQSRNRAARGQLMLETHRAIARDLGLPVP